MREHVVVYALPLRTITSHHRVSSYCEAFSYVKKSQFMLTKPLNKAVLEHDLKVEQG